MMGEFTKKRIFINETKEFMSNNELNHFACERQYIESVYRPNQRFLLIELYCGHHFSFINLVDHYYRSLDTNIMALFAFMIITYPILYYSILNISEKYLADGMKDLAKKLHLSPNIAAVTLLAFASGSSELVGAYKHAHAQEGTLITICTLYAGFLFSGTLVISNVVWNSAEELKLPKSVIIKELVFYLLSIGMVATFALRQRTGFLFLIYYISLYVIYLLITFYIEKTMRSEMKKALEIIDHHIHTDHHTEHIEKMISRSKSESDHNNHSFAHSIDPHEVEGGTVDIKQDEERNNGPHDANVGHRGHDHSGHTFDENITLYGIKNSFLVEIMLELIEDEEMSIKNMIMIPLNMIGLFTVSYNNNPFMKTNARFIILIFSSFCAVRNLNLFDHKDEEILIISTIVSIICFVLEKGVIKKAYMENIYQLISIFSALGWVTIIASVVIDYVTFIAFYFNINEVIVACLLLSAGNLLGEYNINGSLARSGAAIMSGIASYSSPIFNNFVGFSINIYASLDISDEFDIFSLGKHGLVLHSEEENENCNSIFAIFMITAVVLLIVIKFWYYMKTDFVIRKNFTYFLIVYYCVFVVIAALFGIYTQKVQRTDL